MYRDYNSKKGLLNAGLFCVKLPWSVVCQYPIRRGSQSEMIGT